MMPGENHLCFFTVERALKDSMAKENILDTDNNYILKYSIHSDRSGEYIIKKYKDIGIHKV